MKRILISAVLALALAGTTAFAAQNKNAPAKKPAVKTAAASMSNTGAKKPAVKKRRKRAATKVANANAGSTMTGVAKKPAAKKGNSNK